MVKHNLTAIYIIEFINEEVTRKAIDPIAWEHGYIQAGPTTIVVTVNPEDNDIPGIDYLWKNGHINEDEIVSISFIEKE